MDSPSVEVPAESSVEALTPVEAVSKDELLSAEQPVEVVDTDVTADGDNQTEVKSATDEATKSAELPELPSEEAHPVDAVKSSDAGNSEGSAGAAATGDAETAAAPSSETVGEAPQLQAVGEAASALGESEPPVESSTSPMAESVPALEANASEIAPAVEAAPAPKIEETEAAGSTPEPASTDNTTTAPVDSSGDSEAATPAPAKDKKAKQDKKQASQESFVSEETLAKVQQFLTVHIRENQCSSHSKEIHEFVTQHLSEKQQKRYVTPLLERIVKQFTLEAADKGEDVSVDVQSNICLVEQMFLAMGRRSPLEDMYTQEEEEMLDLLFHSNSSDNLPIDG